MGADWMSKCFLLLPGSVRNAGVGSQLLGLMLENGCNFASEHPDPYDGHQRNQGHDQDVFGHALGPLGTKQLLGFSHGFITSIGLDNPSKHNVAWNMKFFSLVMV
jgi:hypothetical protein